MLGVSGLGKHQAHFIIVSVKNQYWQDILVNNSIQMGNYQISMLGEYIDYRMRQLKKVQLQESQLPKEQQKSFSHVSDACLFRDADVSYTIHSEISGCLYSGSSNGSNHRVHSPSPVHVGLL